jgi:deoxyribose-phosphate aldolase
MDWQSVKEKVTAEVVRQLQASGVASSPDKVQELVVAAMSAQASAPAVVAEVATALPTCEVGEGFKTDLLVVVAGPICDQVISVIKSLASSAKVTVVSSGSSPRLAELQACQHVSEGTEATARRLVQGATTVVVPVITTSTAAKVASLIGDCLASAVLVNAALASKQVVVARESIAAPANATYTIRRKVEEVVITLRNLGFTVTDLAGLTSAVSGKGGAPVARTGGYVPAYQPRAYVQQASQYTRAQTAATLVADFDQELAHKIDHTLLKPDATAKQVEKLCKEALEYQFASVCINPTWVALAHSLLSGSPVKVCTVIGFPLGAATSNTKALEAADAITKGATEVDMVLNVGALKSSQYEVVLDDIKAVVGAAKGKALVKVILETGLLTNEEKVKACELAKQAGADFVKTSTGFGPGGATVEDIALMRKTVGPSMGIKASGGIRDYAATDAMIKAGATRIGASAGVNIVKRVKTQTADKGKY